MIKPQFQNKVNGSMFLWLNNLLAQRGSGFNNFGSRFYPVQNKINGLYTYGAPFSQFISDSSVSGALVPTGIYLNNTYINTGESGFFGINHENGYAYFNTPVPSNVTISGAYSVKDFNIDLTDEPEEKILFETKMKIRPKTYINPTGLATNETSYPIIFIKNDEYKNEPFAFGGTETTQISYSLFVFADSKYQIDAVEGLICDCVRNYIPIFELSEMPYDAYGRLKNSYFNYETVKQSKTPGSQNTLFISDINKSRFSQKIYSELKTINPEAFFSIVNINVSAVRNPRNQ